MREEVSDEIVGYLYRFAIFCPMCVIPAIDGQAPVDEPDDVEPKLDYLAMMLGIDRAGDRIGTDEPISMDGFPKPIRAENLSYIRSQFSYDFCNVCSDSLRRGA